MHTRHLTASAALAATLLLAACGGNVDDTASDAGSGSGGHGGGHSASSAAPSATDADANEADIAFLTGMRPHHRQAVEMSEMVLAATPPASVAELARQVKAAQDPEIAQMDQMLADLGQPSGDATGGGHAGGHGGMMGDAEMKALEQAEGAQAARLYLTGMIKHHEGAIEAAEAELADGTYEPARQLATTIAEDQAAEITELEQLLKTL